VFIAPLSSYALIKSVTVLRDYKKVDLWDEIRAWKLPNKKGELRCSGEIYEISSEINSVATKV
jgi:hypothetical protein